MFDEWFEYEFVKKINELRMKYKYDGPGLLILDGASAHYSNTFFKLCEAINFHVIYLPPHSSNQTQPMDLGIFHLHKNKIRHLDLNEVDESMFVKSICKLLFGWEQIATTQNIMGTWTAMGTAFEIGGSSCTFVRFKKEFAMKLKPTEKRTTDDKCLMALKRKSYGNNHYIIKKELIWMSSIKLVLRTRVPKIKKIVFISDEVPGTKLSHAMQQEDTFWKKITINGNREKTLKKTWLLLILMTKLGMKC